MANRLADESSPYLLQHQGNPVDWYAWGPEALERARREDRPIFLSIGYSACHWCHVMEHESFENDEIARQLNEAFVCIKVDREERPDLDHIYMNAVQLLTGHGGWPMSVFLTPQLEPFYGGTYWPPQARMGMPGFDQVIAAVHEAWDQRREKAREGAAEVADQLRRMAAPPAVAVPLSEDGIDAAAATLERIFDFSNGGFGRAPKFPHSMDLQVLLRYWRRHRRDGAIEMVRLSLEKMAAGGIYDHLGGGFARYAVDERWLVPHFEKMLYDNALLAAAYLDGYQATGEEEYARVVRETLDYVLRDMRDASGGFYSTEDADSEGVEGKFYVWTPDELREVLGAEAAKTFAYIYDVTDAGNFEGKNILNLAKTIGQCAKILDRDEAELAAELAESRAKLLTVRGRRVRPGRDDKVLVSWNGLMIDALARAAGVLGEAAYLEAATTAADFLLADLRREDGRLLHTWRQGTAKLDAYLDDYAALTNALVSVYEAGFDERYIDEALRLADILLRLFRDQEGGGFFYTAEDHEPLIARTKDMQDSSVPSGNALAATALLRLGKLSGRNDLIEAAVETLEAAAGVMHQSPTAAGQMLLALDMHLGPTRQIVLLGDRHEEETSAVLADLERRFLPNKVVALRSPQADSNRSPALDPLFAGKTADGPGPTLFVCEDFTCQAPVKGREAIERAWDRLGGERTNVE